MKNKYLKDLIRISNIVGADPRLVQGGGGNTSVKTQDGLQMYIKASGTALKDMNFNKGWRLVSLPAILAIFKNVSLRRVSENIREKRMVCMLLEACEDNAGTSRPSVEAPMHAILGHYVIHVHALDVLAFASAKNGKTEIARIFKDEKLPPLWIPYADPGFTLGRKVFSFVNRYTSEYNASPRILVMEKHGLVIASDTADGAVELLQHVIASCRERLSKNTNRSIGILSTDHSIGEVNAKIEASLFGVTRKRTKVTHVADETVYEFLACSHPDKLLRAPALTPDEMGFINSMLWIRNDDLDGIDGIIGAYFKKNQKAPTTFLIDGVGMFIASEPNLIPIIRDIALGSLYIRMHASKMDGINSLNLRQRKFIENWEAENFRIQLATKNKA